MISVDNLSLYFGAQNIFEGISFMINKGDKIGLVGKNGSGKSTLLKLLTNNLKPNEGKLFIDGVVNAGSVFLGNYTPESAGDYASGTNHTLPTNGYAKSYSGVSLDSYTKKITYQKISKKGLQSLGPIIEIMAEAEELFAHKNAVTLRLKELD